MLTILYCHTGTKYNQWWVKNLKHMIDNVYPYQYKFEGVTQGEGSVYDKLALFRDYTQGQYLYFDLDTVIRDNIECLIREEFTLLKAWWRLPAHTPLNSSIVSWKGDVSYIYEKFHKQYDYNMVKYYKGIDQFLYEQIDYNEYDKVCWSWRFDNRELDYPVCLFNQSYQYIDKSDWVKKYILTK